MRSGNLVYVFQMRAVSFVVVFACVACSSTPDNPDGSNPEDGGGGGDGTRRGADGAMPEKHVPPRMCVRMVGTCGSGMRQITFASNGDLYGTTAGGSIRMWHDANSDGVMQNTEVVTWASTGGNGNNCHVDEKGGFVYAG